MESKSSPNSSKHYYVYVDRTDEGVPFYVGKGSTRRVKNLRRNGKHKHVSYAHGLNRTIECETLDETLAFERERALIIEYHTFIGDPRSGPLACNLTEGGDGTSGFKWTPEAIAKVCDQRKGRNNRQGLKHSLATRQKQRESKLGAKNPNFGKPVWNSGKSIGSAAAKKGWENRRVRGNTSSKISQPNIGHRRWVRGAHRLMGDVGRGDVSRVRGSCMTYGSPFVGGTGP